LWSFPRNERAFPRNGGGGVVLPNKASAEPRWELEGRCAQGTAMRPLANLWSWEISVGVVAGNHWPYTKK
jgi:hypothetical protein